MTTRARNLFKRIPGGPPAGYQTLAGGYEQDMAEADPDQAPRTVNLHESMAGLSIYGNDEISLFGPQYGSFAPRNPPGTSSKSRAKVVQAEPYISDDGPSTVTQLEDIITVPSIYGNCELPTFGSRYGTISSLRQKRPGIESKNKATEGPAPVHYQQNSRTDRGLNASTSVTCEARDSPLQAFADGPAPTSCTVCTEDFTSTNRPPKWISQNCSHKPTTCSDCLMKCIKVDLESKPWNQIMCPECNILLIYEDIRRLADPQTFSRYETMSFRSAVSADPDFIWCQNCDFGQLHASGERLPIVRCLNCGFRTCYRHSIPWHDRLTCDEYDKMLQDPDNFQSAIDKDHEAAQLAAKLQEEKDEELARSMMEKEKQAEKDRQRQLYEEQLRRAREEQEAEARRIKEKELQKMREDIKRKQREEALSMDTVQKTTKACPGCRWPIEKNKGCAHMTCIKCQKEFCWNCLSDYHQILRHGNSWHQKTCQFHSDNLPS